MSLKIMVYSNVKRKTIWVVLTVSNDENNKNVRFCGQTRYTTETNPFTFQSAGNDSFGNDN